MTAGGQGVDERPVADVASPSNRDRRGMFLIPRWLLAESIVAGPNYNRWLFPPAALLIHLSIGQAYAYSVFNKPLAKLCRTKGATTVQCNDWNLVQIGWVFTFFFIFLGSSAAVFGRRLERLGPRFAGVVAAICWGCGYLIAAAAVRHHSLPLLFIGNGVIGGIGLGFGYISPVSTLMRWFPDRRGMASGLAIGGFGGGAVIGAPLGTLLMQRYPVYRVFFILGLVYMCAMLIGAFTYRIPPPGWRPKGWSQPTNSTAAPTTGTRGETRNHTDWFTTYTDANVALSTPQFWLLWLVLFTNVTCGIALLASASPIIQEMFNETPAAAAGIVGMLSLFNIFGRLLWSSVSDRCVSRWNVYNIFFIVGCVLYGCMPSTGHKHNFAAFFVCIAVVMTFYGGGFASIPAYISDIFGIKHSGAIHGRVLTAWSFAAWVGPYMLNCIRQREVRHGRPVAKAYDKTLYILCGLLVVGLISNLLVPLALKYMPVKRTSAERVAPKDVEEAKMVDADEEQQGIQMTEQHQDTTGHVATDAVSVSCVKESGAVGVDGGEVGGVRGGHADLRGWTLVCVLVWWAVPLTAFAWGLYQAFKKALKAFH